MAHLVNKVSLAIQECSSIVAFKVVIPEEKVNVLIHPRVCAGGVLYPSMPFFDRIAYECIYCPPTGPAVWVQR